MQNYTIKSALNLFQAAAPNNRTMKLSLLALTIALLVTAGESVTDSPLSKHNLCCCTTGTQSAACWVGLR